MAANDGDRGGKDGRRKPGPITIDLSATSVRVEPEAADVSAVKPDSSPAVASTESTAAAPEPVPEPAVTKPAATDVPTTPEAGEAPPAAEPSSENAKAVETTPPPAEPETIAEASVRDEPVAASGAGEPPDGTPPRVERPAQDPEPQSAGNWSRLLVAALLGGVVGVVGVHLLAAAGLSPNGSDIAALNDKTAWLDKKIAALAADPEHSLAAVTKELEAEKARVAGLNAEIERLKQLPQVPGASVAEIARILEPFSGRVAAATMHMDEIEKRIAAEQAVVRGETKATGEAVTERIAKLESSVSQRLAAVETATTASADKATKSVAAVDKLTNDFAALDKRASGDIAVARGELKALGDATKAKFAAIDSATTALADAIKANGTDLGALKGALDALAAKLTDLDRRISAELAVIRGTANTLASQTEKQATQTGDTVGKLQREIAALDEMRHAIDGLGARVGAFDEVKKAVAANSARLGELDQAKKAADGVAASLWTVDQRIANLQAKLGEVDALKAQLANGSQKIGTLDERLAPIEAKLATFDNWAKEGVATRNEAIAAIAVAGLKSAVDSGRPFASELAAAKTIAKGLVDLSGLDAYAAKGLATEADLVAGYQKAARKALDALSGTAKAEDGVFGTLLAHATQSVKIRPEGDVAGDAPEARLARIDQRLAGHDLPGALAEWQGLPELAKKASADWGAALQARVEGTKVMAQLSDDVLAKLNAATK